jgi:cytochrome c-type biogenesis protein CcmH
MTLWFLCALMTAAAIFAVLWPLGRGGPPKPAGDEAAVYRDQLAEIDRDAAAGLIGAAEAETARVEISRRLLSAVDNPRDPPAVSNIRLRRATALIGLVGLPVITVAVYLQLGSPQLGDLSPPQRARAPEITQPLDKLVAQVEAQLKKNPGDGRGWNVLAPVLARLGRLDEAIEAWRNAITYGGDSAERRAALGEVMTAAAGGVVTPEARAEFERALALDADEAKASYFLGLSAEQHGHAYEAASIWRAMLAKAPPDAPWRPLVQAALLRVGGASAPALSDDTMAAAKDMNASDRGAMIRGMVERLAGRLKQDGGDVEGWLRLVRAYLVMGDRDKARAALNDARQAVANDAEQLRQLNEGLKALGLDG